MSDEGTIKVPTWALPIGAAALSGAMVWGASQAQAQATQEEVDRIEAAVVSVVVLLFLVRRVHHQRVH